MWGLPSSSVYLMFTGAFATCVAQALYRRDPYGAAAFGVAFLLSAECGGVPASVVAWGVVAWTASVAFGLLALLSTALECSFATILGLVGGIALLASPASARARIAELSLHRPPAPAIVAEAMLRSLVNAP
jgi:hypothetical protein